MTIPSTSRARVVLPFPPTLNMYWRNVRGRTLISADGRKYRVQVVRQVLAERVVSFPAEPIKVSIVAFLPDNRRRDLDNMLKAPLDALAHAHVYEDDSQIADLRISKGGIDRANPRLEITLEAA